MAAKEHKDFINLGIVLNQKGQVLMIKRKNPEKGKNEAILKWSFPGGAQCTGEERGECVERTVLSETGYKIKVSRQIDLVLEHSQFPVMIAYHLCETESSKPIAEPKETQKIAEIKWVNPEEIKELITTELNPKVAQELGLN